MIPRAIIFDLDDTLIDIFGRPQEVWLTVVREFPELTRGRDPAAVVETINVARDRVWNDPAQRVNLSKDLRAARRHIVETAFVGLGINQSDLITRVADRFSAVREANIELFAGAWETLDALRRRGVPLALLTNGGTLPQREKIKKFDLAPFFEHILIEEELGVGKPQRRAFELALGRLGVPGADAWMIGNDLEWDIEGAQAVGIHSIWFNPDGEELATSTDVKPDAEITTLQEILDLIDD